MRTYAFPYAAVWLALLLAAGLGVPSCMRASDSKADDSATSAAHPAAMGDELLEALLTELDRSKLQLKMDQVQAPYYIEYRVNDVDDFSAEAAFGAARENQRAHLRILRVVVRIGDYKLDSYYGRGQGSATILPVDNDSIALRRQIWLLTDQVYKAAADSYAEKLSALKQLAADPNPVDDFAKAPVVSDVSDTARLSLNEDEWSRTLEDVTKLYRDYPELQSVTASAHFNAVNEYFVNSEGTVVRHGCTTATVALGSSAQAADGMRLARSPFWTEVSVEQLPSRAELLKESKKMLDTLKALRDAPIVEESYRGPVLFSPDAADDVIASLIGTNVQGHKPQLGRPNRTTGAFATSYQTRVLPKFVSVVDDPTLKQFGGKTLTGSYDVDSEGVRAQAVTVVNQGLLESYLVGRQPLRDFAVSNGHGRSVPGGVPQPNLGVLLVKSAEPEPVKSLNEKLRHLAKEQGKSYGYRVETMGQPNTPRLLYRVYVDDGHEELVRGAVFNELDVRAIRNDLAAVGDDPLVSNRVSGVPQTIISPSLLFDELEVKRADTTKEKLPEYPAPELKK